MTKQIRDKHAEWLKNAEYAQAYDALEQEFSIASALIKARAEVGLTQVDVAQRMGISQPAVARIEAGKNVSMKTLAKYARAIGKSIHFEVLPV